MSEAGSALVIIGLVLATVSVFSPAALANILAKIGIDTVPTISLPVLNEVSLGLVAGIFMIVIGAGAEAEGE